MKKRSGVAPVELMVLKEVWRRGKGTVQEIRDAVADRRPLAYTTVLTILRTLETKGVLTHEEVNRKYVYRARVTEREVTGNMLKDLLERVFEGSRELLLTRLFEMDRLDEHEVKLIRQKLSEFEGSRGSQISETPKEGGNE